ncbi:hypothetical protein SRHO_G00161250 [Serrasalmus rhombeus]
MARFELLEFVVNPTWEQFDACRKTDLLLVALFFSAIVPRSTPKREIKTVLETHLVRLGILPERKRSLGVALGHTDGSERRPRMDPGGALSSGLDSLLAVQLKELELEIKIQEREAEALRLKAVQVSAERDLELRGLSLAGDKPVPLPWSTASLPAQSPTTTGPQAAAVRQVPKPRSRAHATAAEMKRHYDRKAINRTFNVGDHVLALLPVTGSALQTRFCGPYEITEKLSSTDYVLATDRRRTFSQNSCEHVKAPCRSFY